MRRVDKLGRIVIPRELRDKYGMTEGTEVEFIDSSSGVTVKPAEPFCRICYCKDAVNSETPLCKECIEKIVCEYREEEHG